MPLEAVSAEPWNREDLLMKRPLFVFLTMVLLMAPVTLAQEEAPQFVNLFIAHTKLGHQPQYEAAVKDLWAALKKAGGDFPVFASQSTSSPGDYTFATLLSSLADMDAQGETFNKVFADNAAALAGLAQHSNGNESIVIARRPDLGFQPDNPRVPQDERNFARSTLLYASPEHALALEGVLKEYAELSAKKGIRDPYSVSQNLTGEGPVYRIRTLARSEADYHAQAEKNNATLGEEGNALRAKAGPMLKKIEMSSSVRRPDLSYRPQTGSP